MKAFHAIICLAVILLLVWMNQTWVPPDQPTYGGLTYVGWASLVLVGLAIGSLVIFNDSTRAFGFFRDRDEYAEPPPDIRVLDQEELKELRLDKYRGPVYPHPVIFPDRCIGCQACVDACPHDVLAIVDGRAAAVAPDLCMEDTACQAECPVNPKACIVINTTKEVRSLPTPARNGTTFETNVPGCFIIGDVSGVPLIKNAVKEGADVIAHIADELRSARPEANADYDVAVIGIGPGGASAAAAACEANLRYVGIEQDKILSTIELYPKGKYIFFKPDTKDWTGGIPAAGLGLSKQKYGITQPAADDQAIMTELGPKMDSIIGSYAPMIHDEVISNIPSSVRAEASAPLSEKIRSELTGRIVEYVRSRSNGGWLNTYETEFLPHSDAQMTEFGREISDQLQKKIPGDQRENILRVWHSSLAEKGVVINENESCKSVQRADDGDYFLIQTERGSEKVSQTYKSRRVVLSIGLRGAPNKLRLPNEDLKTTIDGQDVEKVIYGLSDPMQFRGRRIVVVGGGNVAVEAAVDLVAVRDGSSILPRSPQDMNQVTLLVRDFLAPTVKFGNKFQLYKCADDGLIDIRFGIGIKEMHEREVVLEDVRTKNVLGSIPNDFVFALIGGERPNRFLESIGITIK
jgi:thioredoxin reductase